MEELRRIREKRGWSQARLARESGVNRATINTAEQGKRSPGIGTLGRLADALEVGVGDFFPKTQPPLPLEVAGAPIRVGFGGNTVTLKTVDEYRATAEKLRRFVRAAEEGREDGSEFREVMEALDEFSTAYGAVGRGDPYGAVGRGGPEHPALREMDAIAHELHGVMVELRAEYERRGRATGERLGALAKTA